MVSKHVLIIWIGISLALAIINHPLHEALASSTDKYSLELSTREEIQVEHPVYMIQSGTPVWLPNFVHPEQGCNWLGIAGQVFDRNMTPNTNLVMEVGGNLEGMPVNYLTLTGLAQEYGSGGYEIVLKDRVVDSTQELWIQIHDLSGSDISEKYYFDTYADCERNLVLINFVQRQTSGETYTWYFPMIYKTSTFFDND